MSDEIIATRDHDTLSEYQVSYQKDGKGVYYTVFIEKETGKHLFWTVYTNPREALDDYMFCDRPWDK